MNPSQPEPLTAWVVTDGTVGMENQCVALAAAVGVQPTIKRIAIRAPWRWLPPRLWVRPLAAVARLDGSPPLAPPWPDLLIATGRQTVAPAAAIRRAAGGRTFAVQLQDPKVALDRFDLVIAPAHDQLAGANQLATAGAMHAVTPQALATAAGPVTQMLADLPRPLVAVVLGGPNGAYSFDAAQARILADQLARLAGEQGVGLAITTSRRTPDAVVETLESTLAGLPAVIWNANAPENARAGAPNPYIGFLALADWVLVTGDSVNMVSEATGTAKPVYVIDLPGGSAKFTRFHVALRDAGITRRFDGRLESWTYEPLDDTGRAAVEIRRRLGLDPG